MFIDILKALAVASSWGPGLAIISHCLIKWAAYLVVLNILVQGGGYAEKSSDERIKLREDTFNCFVDDPKLAAYFEHHLHDISSQLAPSTLDNPFANAAAEPLSSTAEDNVPTVNRGKKR